MSRMDIVLEGVIHALTQVLQNLPDDAVKDTVTSAVLPEFILVLANHPVSRLRAGAVRLMWQYVSRTHSLVEAHGFRLLKMEGYLLLANLLHQFKVVPCC